jgi:hypothetical protein
VIGHRHEISVLNGECLPVPMGIIFHLAFSEEIQAGIVISSLTSDRPYESSTPDGHWLLPSWSVGNREGTPGLDLVLWSSFEPLAAKSRQAATR